MGLFSKLKANMSHGGVKVRVQAPASVPSNQVIPVTVSMTADSAQTINGVKAEIQAQARETGMSIGGNNMLNNNMPGMNNGGIGMQRETSTYNTVAQVESRDPITIGPGETKTVNLQLYVNGSTTTTNQLGNAGGALGGAIQTLANVAQNFDHVNYIYRVKASADVDGVTMDPSDHQSIQLLPPAQAEAAPQAIQN